MILISLNSRFAAIFVCLCNCLVTWLDQSWRESVFPTACSLWCHSSKDTGLGMHVIFLIIRNDCAFSWALLNSFPDLLFRVLTGLSLLLSLTAVAFVIFDNLLEHKLLHSWNQLKSGSLAGCSCLWPLLWLSPGLNLCTLEQNERSRMENYSSLASHWIPPMGQDLWEEAEDHESGNWCHCLAANT